MTKEEFLTAAKAAALESARTSGLPAGVTVAQAALESAWGKSQLSRTANNYFGIKAHGDLPWVELPTSEVISGAAVRVSARFAQYESMTACFAARDQMILRLPVYADARASVHDAPAFIKALARHWATDPRYAGKLERVYRENGLEALDSANGSQHSAGC
jgi:flagellum-specific peptidoglycan hydrolase FlgJ